MRGLIVGTGPSLRGLVERLPNFDGLVFVCNNTPQHVDQEALKGRLIWLACDPKWHELNGAMPGDFAKWHWDQAICEKYGYTWIEGRWADGLSPVPSNWISYNHCSGAQLLNLATSVYCCDEVYLIGHDFQYAPDQPRHYFDDLSDVAGEYPEALRKHSEFDKKGEGYDLMAVYKKIADQDGLPPIYNITQGSALRWFPFRKYSRYI